MATCSSFFFSPKPNMLAESPCTRQDSMNGVPIEYSGSRHFIVQGVPTACCGGIVMLSYIVDSCLRNQSGLPLYDSGLTFMSAGKLPKCKSCRPELEVFVHKRQANEPRATRRQRAHKAHHVTRRVIDRYFTQHRGNLFLLC